MFTPASSEMCAADPAFYLRIGQKDIQLIPFHPGAFGLLTFGSAKLAVNLITQGMESVIINCGRDIHVIRREIKLSKKVLTENDLDVEEKKVFGRIIDMWSLGSEDDPYAQSSESEVINYSKTDGLSEEQILKVLKNLEDHRLIHMDDVNGKVHIKYNAEAVHIVKELQKTAYVHSRKKFIPHHH
jgi:hypothetical protein